MIRTEMQTLEMHSLSKFIFKKETDSRQSGDLQQHGFCYHNSADRKDRKITKKEMRFNPMKKIVLVILTVVLLVSLFGGETGSKAASMDFVSIDRQFRNGQFIVKGHLLNHSDKTITGIKNGYILLCDADGKVRSKVALDASLKNCSIGPSGSLAYSFVMDASKVKFDYAFDIYFDVEAKCTFGKAKTARPYTPYVPQPTSKPAPAPDPGPERVLCTVCKTTGHCSFCDGGVYTFLGKSNLCTSCHGSNDCFKCDGNGFYYR